MKPQQKLRGGKKSEMTRFKSLWLYELSAEDKAEFVSWFETVDPKAGIAPTQLELRARIKKHFGIALKHNSQLSEFRDWAFAQLERDAEADLMRLDEERLQEKYGSTWTLDQIREEAIKMSYARSIATGNFDQALRTVREDRGLLTVKNDREKFQFDAAEACLKHLPQLRQIAAQPISQNERIQKVRQLIFGQLPE